jgi:putative tryptophan/tyrosine transport system substrate-binding protein
MAPKSPPQLRCTWRIQGDRMRRREVLALIAGAGAWPLTARAQQTTKVARVGHLAAHSPDAPFARRNLDAFRQGLQDLGYIEGQNIAIEYRSAESKYDRLPGLAAELVQLQVDIIVAGPTAVAIAAKNATETIPIVASNVGDPVRLGLVASLARPGGNVTGLAYSVGLETIVKGLELFKDAVPDLHRVAVLSNPANPSQALAVGDLEIAARTLGMQLQQLEARGPDEFDNAFAAMAKEGVAALFVSAEGVFARYAARLADLALKNRLPSMYGLRENVEAGGLMSYGPDIADQSRRAAAFVDKILRGAKPADLPMQQPTKFELVINVRTARALGLEIPQSLLAAADEVIE